MAAKTGHDAASRPDVPGTSELGRCLDAPSVGESPLAEYGRFDRLQRERLSTVRRLVQHLEPGARHGIVSKPGHVVGDLSKIPDAKVVCLDDPATRSQADGMTAWKPNWVTGLPRPGQEEADPGRAGRFGSDCAGTVLVETLEQIGERLGWSPERFEEIHPTAAPAAMPTGGSRAHGGSFQPTVTRCDVQAWPEDRHRSDRERRR